MDKCKQVVTKHNGLIQAGYRLSLNEIRIVLYGISLINPLAKKFPLSYRIDIAKFAEMFGIESSKNIYEEIKEIVMDKFWEREFTIDISEEKKYRLRWIIGVKYADKQGYIKIFFNPELKPFLHQLTGSFTSYNLEKIAPFQSVYSVRIYEISLMNLNRSGKDRCLFKLEIKALKEQLDIADKYKKFANFRIRVLDLAMKEINKNSDIQLSYKVVKLGRHPHEIAFSITRKTPKQELETLSNNALSPPIIEKAKWLAEGAGTGWEVKELEKQFLDYSHKKGNTRNIENAFLGFVKKKILKTA